MRRGPGALALLVALAAPATPAAGAPAGEPPLRVFAAASLAEAFTAIARESERAGGPRVALHLAGTPQLAAQLEHGAAADVVAFADEHWMAHARARGWLADEPRVFARNRLVVIVPRAGRAPVAGVADLARPGLRLVLAGATVPAGRYARVALGGLSGRAGLPPDYAARVLANLASEEESVRAVVGKVVLGEADAGIVYRSDVTPAVARAVRVLALPDADTTRAAYPIAVLARARAPDAARAFVAFVTGPAGQRLVARHGLIPAAGDR